MGSNVLYAGVFDGAVSRIASHEAMRFFEEEEESLLSARDLLSAINRHLGGVDLRGGASTGTVLGVRASGAIDLAHVTDSWAMIQKNNGTTELLTKDQHEPFERAAIKVLVNVAVAVALPGEVPDLVSARNHPRVKETLARMFAAVRNAPEKQGEGILNGDPNMDVYIQGLDKPFFFGETGDQVEMILLGSDGVRFPFCNETDPAYRRRLFRLVCKLGAAGVVDRIHEQEQVKLPTPEYPRWCLHDDKTLIAIRRM